MKKILIVDDSESQRFRLRGDLESFGYAVIEGSNGTEGLNLLEKNPDISLIITDVNMPGMDGLTMCSKIPQASTGLPVFMLTSEATAELKQMGKKYGVRAWITKPYATDKLMMAITKALTKK
jgi:two-component system chemotaxis response regulator CheY